jgi:hypothetical protein
MSDDNFISRWSRRKHQARRGDEVEPAPPPPAAPPAVETKSVPTAADAPEAPVETPPLESLTPESDFTPFMNAEVDPGLRRQALKTLFSDPRFNVMDGLDVYIDDYSKPDPLPEGWLEKMTQVARLGDYQPPKVPDEEAAGSEPAEEVALEAQALPDAHVPPETQALPEPLPIEDDPGVPEGSPKRA